MQIPWVIEKTEHGERQYDIYSRLLKDRILFLGGEYLTEQSANAIIAQLLFLEAEDPSRDISIYINSPGGVVRGGLAIYDTMQYIKPEIRTICIGLSASIAALILSAGSPGKRFALPHARIMIHQPSGGLVGKATDVDIYTQELKREHNTLNEILSNHTGQSIERISSDTKQDCFFTPVEAKEYGLIDRIF
ncbi:MAG: ATP-dependent Clp protease proteolytic subunit [Caldisericia bacterium]|nr:ATP-dependent Clp protease proteolytic subunit [Caldisericia bacterium]MDD4613973.1 ATP-dependent Clp protease proteolytic subunit [Caldisericia bacterium]